MTTYAYGYGAMGPVAIPLDGAPPAGYGNFVPMLIAPGSEPYGDGALGTLGTPPQEVAASAAGGAATAGGVWTGVAVGLAVWAITKLLDRYVFDERRPRYFEED